MIGVSRYANPDLNLAFAAKDAHDFARALKIGAGRLYGEERVRLYYCSSEAGQPNSPFAPPDLPAPVPVRKSELARIFAAINRQAQPRDIVVVYLAGHGVAYRREEKSGYAYLTQDARSPDVVNSVFLKDHAVTAEDLIEWTRLSRVNKQILILDTCYAGVVGHVLARLPDAPRSSADRIRALEQAKVAAGFHILMGCAGHRASYESSRYGQGLLTRALLQGLQGAALEGRIANVERWFKYAQDTVPDLAREANLPEQRPQISRPGSGEGFPVGEFTGAEVMLPNARPIILTPTGFFNRDTLLHDRPLKDAVGEQLLKLQEEAMRKGASGDTLLFTYLRGVAEHPHALIPSGSYTVQNGEAVVKVRLEKGATFGEKDVRGPDPGNGREALAARIAAAIVELARDLERK